MSYLTASQYEHFDDVDSSILGKPADRYIPKSIAFRLTIVYVGLFVIRPWERLFPELAVLRIERYYAILMIVAVFGTCGFRMPWNSTNKAVAFFGAALGVSTALAWDIHAAWNDYYVFLTIGVCYLVLSSVIRTPYELVLIIVAYIGFMELYMAKALWEYFVHSGGQYRQGVKRLIGIESTYGNFNALAGTIVTSLPLWLVLWRRQLEIFAEWPVQLRRWLKYALALYPLLSALCVALTNSRMGMANLAAFVVLWTVTRHGLFRAGVLSLLILSAGWLVLPEDKKDRIRSIWDPTVNQVAEESKQGRIDAFYAAMDMFETSPITGVGLGNFMRYRVAYLDGVQLEAHNIVSQVIAEVGVLGAVAFATLIVVILANSRRAMRIARNYTSQPTMRVLEELSKAYPSVIFLLFVEGVSQHNLLRYNWLWIAAFASLTVNFTADLATKSTPDEPEALED